MQSERRGRQASARSRREDGEATKARIIETAGRLFAERGYADTTSKDICERARTNMAAVNYHFGSREGLYLAVLEQAHDSLFNLEYLRGIVKSDMHPRGKMARFVEYLISAIYSNESWQVRMWGREMSMPTGLPIQHLQRDGMEKFRLVAVIISELTGMPLDAADMKFCVLNVMAPFMVLLTMSRKEQTPHQPVFQSDPTLVADNMKKFIFSGLEAYMTARRRSDEKESLPMTSAL